MIPKTLTLLATVITFAVLFDVVVGSHVLDVFRVLQFDSTNPTAKESSLGCRRTKFSAPAIAYDTFIQDFDKEEAKLANDKDANKTKLGGAFSAMTRHVVLLPLDKVTVAVVQRLVNQNSVVGLVIMVDSESNSKFNEEQIQNVMDVEAYLLTNSIQIPVYFAQDDAQLKSIYQHIHARMHHTYEMVVDRNDETQPIPSFVVSNLQAKLEEEAESKSRTTIAVVAHYDTMGAVPEMTRGANANGSGVIALLEILRLFSKIFAHPRLTPKYDLLFLLNGAGRLNYAGTRHWLQTMDAQTLDTIEFALCLESLASTENLFLHISKKTKDANIIRLYKEFQNAASRMDIPFEFVHKRINLTHSEMGWEHEGFAYRKISAATLSSQSRPRPLQFARSSIMDERVNPKLLQRNIRFISESLARFMYGSPDAQDIEIFAGDVWGLNQHFVDSWVETMQEFSRPAPFVEKDHPATSALEKSMRTYSSQVVRQDFIIGEAPKKKSGKNSQDSSNIQATTVHVDYKFYGGSKVQLSIFKVQSWTFDLLVAVPIALYLLALHIFLAGTEPLKEFIDKTVFNRKKVAGKTYNKSPAAKLD